MKVRWKNNAWVQILCLRELSSMQEMFDQAAHGDLSLHVGLLMNRGGNCASLKIGNHLPEKVGRYQSNFVRVLRCGERATDRKTVHRVDIDSGKLLFIPEQSRSFAKTLVGMLVAFDHCDNLCVLTLLSETRDESFRLLAMIDGLKHSSNDRDLGPGAKKVCHELAGDESVQPRLDAHYRRALTYRGVSRNAYNTSALLFRCVDQGSHGGGIARCHYDAANLCFE